MLRSRQLNMPHDQININSWPGLAFNKVNCQGPKGIAFHFKWEECMAEAKENA